MRLCVATNWQDDYLVALSNLPADESCVHEVFGSLPRSVVGSGRDASLVPALSKAQAERHIRLAHDRGLRFNYLVNGSCMGGAEYAEETRRDIEGYFAWIRDAGADAVTIAIPFLAEVLRKVAPNIEVVVSTIANVDCLRKAERWQELGADRITLSLMVNRDFPLLEAMRKSVDCELELLANEMCLYDCPYRAYHYDLMAHASQDGESLANVEYPHLMCTMRRMADPGEFLKARFLRPEDVVRYEAIGLDLIKLAGRGRDTEGLLRAVSAYLVRRYEGNLLDITDLGFFQAPGAPRPEVFIDNRALDGFLDKVGAVDCRRACGVTCSLCDVLAKDVVSIRQGEGYMRGLEGAHDALLRRRLPDEDD